MIRRWLPLGALLLAACGHDTDHGAANKADAPAAASTPTPAKNAVSLDVPGFKASLDLPGIDLSGNTDIDGMKLFPGTHVDGVAVAATGTTSSDGGSVTMRYTAPATPEALLRYYRDAARGAGFTLATGASDTVHATKGARTDVRIVARPAPGGSAGTIAASGPA